MARETKHAVCLKKINVSNPAQDLSIPCELGGTISFFLSRIHGDAGVREVAFLPLGALVLLCLLLCNR